MLRRPARWILGFVPMLAAAVAFAQPADPQPTGESASVSGLVTDSVTGVPVVRAHISLVDMARYGQQAFGSLTNSEGQFTVAPVPPGQYRVLLERVGYVGSERRWDRVNSVELKPGDKKVFLNLKITPVGSVSGRVLDERGIPRQGCSVAVEDARENSLPYQETLTDDQGRYRIGGLAPGPFRIRVSLPRNSLPAEIRLDGSKEIHLARTWYPSSLERKSAQRVQVEPGASLTGLDIRMIATPLVSVFGKVSGIPPGAQVGVNARPVRQGDNSASGFGRVSPDGTFRIWHLDPGQYVLIAESRAAGDERLTAVPVHVDIAGSNIGPLDLPLMAPLEVSGKLNFEDSGARGPAANRAPPGPNSRPTEPYRVSLRPVDGGPAFGVAGAGNSEIAADDTIRLAHVPPARYHVTPGWRGAYVKSVRIGSVETEGDVLDLRTAPAGPVTISVSSLMVRLSGKVTNANGPVAGVQIGLRPDADIPNRQAFATTGPAGQYHLEAPPGTYRILVTDRDSLSLFLYARYPDDFGGEIVELRAGQTLTKDLVTNLR